MAKGNLDLDERELQAAQAMSVAYASPTWRLVPRDVAGAPPGTHDFDLTDDTITVAVEVSTIADTDIVRDGAEWSRHFPDGVRKVEGLASGWLIAVSHSARARDVGLGLTQWLVELERLGIASARTDRWQDHLFAAEGDRPSRYRVFRAMAAAGVTSAEVASELAPGDCAVVVASDGYVWSSTDDEYVSQFVSLQLAGPHASDVQKLARTAADRRVLFLWLDAQSHFDVIRRLDNQLLGGTLVNAGSLDEVWLGRRFVDGSVALYRWCPIEGWTFERFGG